MNVNSQQQTQISIKQWLELATVRLSACDIPTARLDAELILSHVLNVNRTFLHAHSDHLIDKKNSTLLETKLELRLKRVPLAYITGKKEFYGREFLVSTDTLIPRPESEELIDSLKKLFISNQPDIKQNIRLIDVGTGCGILGITAKLELPDIDVTLTDVSSSALKVARKNAKKLNACVTISNGNLLSNYDDNPDVVIANLPYVDPDWERSPETNFEPALALFATDSGQALIKRLILEASQILKQKGFIILESDPCQHKSLIEFAKTHEMNNILSFNYVLVFQKD